MTSFAPTTTHQTLSRSSTHAVCARCGPRSSATATIHRRPDRRPSDRRNRLQSRPNRRPRSPNLASVVGRSAVFRASGSCIRKSQLQRLQHLGSLVMGKVCEVRRRRQQLLPPNRRPSRRQNSTSNRRWNRSRRRSSDWSRGNANYRNGQSGSLSFRCRSLGLVSICNGDFQWKNLPQRTPRQNRTASDDNGPLRDRKNCFENPLSFFCFSLCSSAVCCGN